MPLIDHPNACFVLADVANGRVVASYNPVRARERFVACSTFKVPLAVLALDRGVIKPDSAFKWDHKQYPYDGWNADQTTRSWLVESVVWVSQGIVPKLGVPAVGRALQAYGFGNADVSGNPGSFWLGSDAGATLKVSADEQLAFWLKLHAGKLAAKPGAQKTVLDFLPTATDANGTTLTGKTGSGRALGWYVGRLKMAKGSYVLACNFSGKTDGPGGFEARKLCLRALVKLGFWKPVAEH